MEEAATRPAAVPEPVWVWGVPFAPLTLPQTVSLVTDLIREGQTSFFITANTHYAMLVEEMPDLRAVNERTTFIVADGKPLVWASRMAGRPLPERVAGSDLIFALSEESARVGHRVYFLGGAPGVADEAAQRLAERYPGLQVVGTVSPPYGDLTSEQEDRVIADVRAAAPDLLIGAFTMPRGERWLSANLGRLGVPVVVNLGASMDFAANRIRRAPVWMQKTGLEWTYRLGLEPRRLAGRYARNAWFIFRKVLAGRP